MRGYFCAIENEKVYLHIIKENVTVPVGVIKESLGSRGCMLSWLSCECYF